MVAIVVCDSEVVLLLEVGHYDVVMGAILLFYGLFGYFICDVLFDALCDEFFGEFWVAE